jgi:ADP-ribosylglycohydrolase/PKD domain
MKTKTLSALFLSLVLALCAFGCGGDDDDTDDDTDDGDTSDDDDSSDDDDDNGDDDDNDVAPESWSISRTELEDKILGAWAGQMAGVTWAAITEFRFCGEIIPEEDVPVWNPWAINTGFIQDDLYVEVPFINAMVDHGPTVSWVTYGDYFKETSFPLWHANRAGRNNLRAGIAAPDSGHYENNEHCDDIDWQIEADFVGQVCPGLPNEAIEISWRAGHVMNYGDGVYGGVFVAAMHAAAVFAESLDEIIDAGVASVPEGSEFYEVIQDVLGWHADNLTWEQTWQNLQDKWGEDDRCPDNISGRLEDHNIDAKFNSAYVLIGLLYGEGDITESMRISMRCGQDSDCNPSTVGAILGNWQGYSAIPEEFVSAMDWTRQFWFTELTLPDAVQISMELAEEIVLSVGGSIEQDTWTIPKTNAIEPPILEQWPANPNDPPDLSMSLVQTDGLTVELQATATDADGIAGYEWYFGDLNRAKGDAVSHTYAATGEYEVIVYTTDSIGNTSWELMTVTVP